MIRIVNASPLITLARAGLQELLTSDSDELLIPDAVAIEIEAGAKSDPARVLLQAGFGRRLSASTIPESVLEWGLGAGESAVISDTLSRPASEAILDDAAARRCARSVGIAVVGTLGIAVRAKWTGRVAAAAPLFNALRDAGLFFSDHVAREALSAVDETWRAQ